jgi:AcrR family transcriptional regulator
MAMDYLRNEPIQKRSRAMVTRIEDAARIVLARIGRDRMTTAQVANEAGIAIGSLYRYFPDRVAILDRIWSDRRDNKPGDSDDSTVPDDGAKHNA